MSNVSTLTELLQANRAHDARITHLGGEQEARTVTYAQLHDRALTILHHLQRLGMNAGDHLLLVLGDTEHFIDAFWAAILGGIVPVPVAFGIREEHRRKLIRIAAHLGAPWIYTERRFLQRLTGFAEQSGDLETVQRLGRRAILTDDLDDSARVGKIHAARPDDVALLQFSSGSTQEPKGIPLTHRNILANARGVTTAAQFSAADVSLSWMPLTHDMGLIGFHLFMFYNQIESYLMPTDLFIRRPQLWLQCASRVGATILCSPNFGYRHYLQALGERSLAGVDLTRVRLIFNGAEPISAELVAQFLERLAPTGLRSTAMYPVYGLAEAALAVSFPSPAATLHTLSVNRQKLGPGDELEHVARGSRHAVQLVGEGKAIPGCQLRIADAQDRGLPPARIGEVQIRGDNVMRGYFNSPEANAAVFTADGWLRTGDLGVLYEGELYITGRIKEIIFANGQNYYPHDLEAMLQSIPGLELGKVVAAGARTANAEIEQLVLFVLHRGTLEEFMPLVAQAMRVINEQTGIDVSEVIAVKRIPKTTSGKFQRHILARDFAAGSFDGQLRARAAVGGGARASTALARSAIAATLGAICANALGGRSVAANDNLFELGASSLKLIEIHEQIDQEYPGMLELTELFTYPTITELADYLEGKLSAVRIPAVVTADSGRT